MDIKETYFYKKYKPLLDAYVSAGNDVNDLKKKDKLYQQIVDIDVFDEEGNKLNTEAKFKILGHERKRKKNENVKQALIDAVDEYLKNGGSFHIERKKLPFYPQLNIYSRHLSYKGIHMTYEEIMKSLGYKQYSDVYYRCERLEDLKFYRDENGYIDSYKKNNIMKNYIESLSDTYDIPYFLIISLLCEEKLKKVVIKTDYLKQTKKELEDYISKYGNLKGIKTKDVGLYNKIITIKRSLNDGSEMALSSTDVLEILGVGDVENNFIEENNENIDIENEMFEIKQKYGNEVVKLNTLDAKIYRKICKKAISMGIYVSDLFQLYGMKCNGITIDRLSKTHLKEIPYLQEMLKRKYELIEESSVSIKNGNCKEEIMERDMAICKQVYEEFKSKIYNFDVSDDWNVN